MKNFVRKTVLKLGGVSLSDLEFINRDLILTPVGLDDLSDAARLNSARAVVFDLSNRKRLQFKTFLGPIFERCADAGLLTIIYVIDDQIGGQVIDMREKFKDSLSAKTKSSLDRWIVLEKEPSKIAERCARRDPGPPIESLNIFHLQESSYPLGNNPLSPQTECLLNRAFHDCKSITVRRLYGGKSAEDTFQVFANPEGPIAGPQPMPFFVKMGAWDSNLAKERTNYLERAQPFIPFHLRPSLNRDRSIEGLKLSALVYDFVENAVPLRTALKQGHGDGVLFSLFEHTLRGLRSHTEGSKPVAGTVNAFVTERVRSQEIPNDRVETAKALGLKRLPRTIEKCLRGLAASRPGIRGFYHGDLHAGNVMVRHRDAILIDFGSMEGFGPLAADPAILEVSLLFGMDGSEDQTGFDKWVAFVNRMLASPCEPPPPSAITPKNYECLWLEDAIRELRHVVVCCGSDELDLLIVLAAALLRYGRISPLESGSDELKKLDERRHAYAIVCADNVTRLAMQCEKKSQSNKI